MLFTILNVACRPTTDVIEKAPTTHAFALHAEIGRDAQAFTTLSDQTLLIAAKDQLYLLEGADITEIEAPLPPGEITLLARGSSDDDLYAWVHGKGLYAGSLDSEWRPVNDGLSSPTLALFNPDAMPTPQSIDFDGEELWMAAIGGLYKKLPEESRWTPQSTASSGALNPIF
ncbi:MAG: hypothetical protein VX278_02020, partial [Myxococcota bacterium]|nr:hypothetical protein [Myxococcota bacterium]